MRGRVLGPDGRPAPNARVVRRFEQSDNTAPCDSEGRFRLETTSAYESAEILVLAEGLLTTRVRFVAPQDGGLLVLPDVHLEAARTIRGRVTDELGAPLAGAQISNQSDFWGRVAESAADGTFEFTGLNPKPDQGRSFLFARLEGRVPTQATVTLDTTLCEIVLARGLTLTGRVVNEKSTPVPHAQVAFEAQFGTGDEPSTRSDVNGRFTLAPIPAGTRYLWIRATGSARRRVKLDFPADVSAIDAGDVVLAPDRALRGRVRTRGRRAAGVVRRLGGAGRQYLGTGSVLEPEHAHGRGRPFRHPRASRGIHDRRRDGGRASVLRTQAGRNRRRRAARAAAGA